MSNNRARDMFLNCLRDCDQAMGGSVPFEVALGQRLELLQPTRQQLDQFLLAEPPRLTDGALEFITALHSRGTAVHLISGGFTDIIYPCAQLVGVPHGVSRILLDNTHIHIHTTSALT